MTFIAILAGLLVFVTIIPAMPDNASDPLIKDEERR